MSDVTSAAPLEMWGGVECTANRVGDCLFDQLAWSGHDRRLADLDTFAALGVRTVRYPVLWERLAPRRPDEIDWTWADERMARLRDLGIRPIVGLVHHGSGPAYTSLLDDEFPVKLARYARAVATRYPWVRDYTPVNEPLTTARFSGLYGHWYPHARSDRAFIRALLNQLRGVVLAMRAIREEAPEARLVQTEDCGRTFGTRQTHQQVVHEGHRRWLTWDVLTGRVDRGHPLYSFLIASGMTKEDERFFLETECTPDVLGLNYYVTSDRYLDDRLERHPEAAHGGNGCIRYADVEAVRARAEGIAGHEAHLAEASQRYGRPVAITEAHLGCTREEQIRWLVEAWEGARAARAGGADVRAVTAWAWLGSFNWNSLVTRNSGYYEPGVFDVRANPPRRTALADVVASVASGADPVHPSAAGPGWWRRPRGRLPVALPGTLVRTLTAPVLVVGASGTLGRAFARICALRGLACRTVGRAEMDITDRAQVDAILRRSGAWVVINAAGYVRVDAAEHDVEACQRANLSGPLNLAATCRRLGIALVTFSSDLVFEGNAIRPYVETDEPRPLNAYGRSKADAERRVRDICPDALVIRTSAFFGPWDEYNFLAELFRTLDSGGTPAAPDDTVVSPTYVPDLVHAALDLAIDGERGLWHLANRGAVSWYEFARAAAHLTGRDAHRVVAARTADVWGPAARPRYSVLGSARAELLRGLPDALAAYVRDRPPTQEPLEDDACLSR